MPWNMRLRTPQAKAEAKAALFEAVQEVFELDIKPAAQRGSPVLTGHNRRSIDTEVGLYRGVIKAQIFSQSGYGGYLELGTRFIKAIPYMWPAFNKYRNRLGSLLKIKIAAIKPGAIRAVQLKLFKEPPEA